jgi:toxin ParE1/3/4
MRIRESLAARRDIDLIFEHRVRHYGRQAATECILGLLNLFDLLARHPDMARERTNIRPPVRIQPYEAHLVIRILPAQSDWATEYLPNA